MSKIFSKSNLSRKQMEMLLNAYLDFKEAEAKFKEIKDKLTKDLPDGKYEIEGLARITKTSQRRRKLDTDSLLNAYPQIDKELFTMEYSATTVTITNLIRE